MAGFSRTRRALLAGVATLAGAFAMAGPASAQTKDVKFMLDWFMQGTHAPVYTALDKGYFKQGGVNAIIEPGKGATNVAVSIASGADQFGMVDLPALILFNARNPGKELVAVYMYYDTTALAIVARKSANINKPEDMAGKKIAGAPGTAARDAIGLIASPELQSKIQWMPIAAQLNGQMIIKGEVDALSGFTNSQIPAALEAGMKMEDLTVLKFSDYGPKMYGLTIATTKEYLDANPEIVRAVVKAINKGLIDAIKSPDEALKSIQSRDKMMNASIERTRLGIALNHVDTETTKKSGLNSVTKERLQETIDAVASVYKIEKPPTVDRIYDGRFEPPASERTYN
jgi:NitT/TauT family transport system substrate-binding protein